MSKMFDYIVNGGGKVAELEASLEHTAGYLGLEVEENQKLRAALVAAKEKLAIYRAQSTGEYSGGMEYTALVKLIDDALNSKRSVSK